MKRGAAFTCVLLLLLAALLYVSTYKRVNQAGGTVGKDIPLVPGGPTADSPENVSKISDIANQVEGTPQTSQSKLTAITLQVSGVVQGHLRSGGLTALDGALVTVKGETSFSIHSNADGSYSGTVKAYSDNKRVYLSVRCSKSGFHTADASTWINLGEAITIPGLQTVAPSVTVNFELYELTMMVYSHIVGRVLDANGNPVKNAVITVYPNFEMAYSFPGEDGTFHFWYGVIYGGSEQPPTQATVTVKAYAQGYKPAEKTVTVTLSPPSPEGAPPLIPISDIGDIIISKS